jgi:hypothetical protein
MSEATDKAAKPVTNTRGPAPAPKASHPAARHDTILTGSGFLEYLRTNGRHQTVGADATEEVAAIMERAITRSSRWPLGIDKRLAARKIRRSLIHAAQCQEAAAQAFARTRTIYLRSVGEPGSLKAAKGGMDPTK